MSIECVAHQIAICTEDPFLRYAELISTLVNAQNYSSIILRDSTPAIERNDAIKRASVVIILAVGDSGVEKVSPSIPSSTWVAVIAPNFTATIPAVRRLLPPLNAEQLTAANFECWLTALFHNLRLAGFEASAPNSVEIVKETKEPLNQYPGDQTRYHNVPIVSKTLLTAPEYDRPSYCVTVDLTDTPLTFNLGDHMLIFPENNEERVTEALKVLHLDGNKVVTVVHSKPHGDLSIDAAAMLPSSPITIRQLLKRYVGFSGKATRSYLLTLSLLATDPLEASQLFTLALYLDKFCPYVQRANGSFSYVKALQQFPSVKISLEQFLSIIPTITPRSYSCASSPLANPKRPQCTFTVLKYPVGDGVIFEGLNTSYMASLNPGETLRMTIKPSPKPVQLDSETQYIGVALGSGIALLRGVSQHYDYMRKAGQSIKPIQLYCGVRHRAEDYIFGDELEEYNRNGTIDLYAAFSHDQEQFITPVHKIKENPDKLVNAVINETDNCFFFYCGLSGHVYQGIEDAIIEVIDKAKPGEGKHYVDKLKKAGKWAVGAYTPDPDPENPFSNQQ